MTLALLVLAVLLFTGMGFMVFTTSPLATGSEAQHGAPGHPPPEERLADDPVQVSGSPASFRDRLEVQPREQPSDGAPPPCALPTGFRRGLALAWADGQRSGKVRAGGVGVDLGREGGWCDRWDSGCCDTFCRLVGGEARPFWSCVGPEHRATQYEPGRPVGRRCAAGFGAAVAHGDPSPQNKRNP